MVPQTFARESPVARAPPEGPGPFPCWPGGRRTLAVRRGRARGRPRPTPPRSGSRIFFVAVRRNRLTSTPGSHVAPCVVCDGEERLGELWVGVECSAQVGELSTVRLVDPFASAVASRRRRSRRRRRRGGCTGVSGRRARHCTLALEGSSLGWPHLGSPGAEGSG